MNLDLKQLKELKEEIAAEEQRLGELRQRYRDAAMQTYQKEPAKPFVNALRELADTIESFYCGDNPLLSFDSKFESIQEKRAKLLMCIAYQKLMDHTKMYSTYDIPGVHIPGVNCFYVDEDGDLHLPGGGYAYCSDDFIHDLKESISQMEAMLTCNNQKEQGDDQ